ncbi:enediyne antibiotic chromoprotein [Streptomyces morookaense]|uniref:Neocarzinostatin family protein n=1 Tax=Streptomyces morookaense TaxID=1970 RepID=A0A7Y7B541_STRMO|nr:enediyne antibiotic chromoprotein [Streptomyces morookaense]NVK79137.1 hypothetical protein [Streptomyces morookaense]GHF28269.1 hypothetical protein GCM10010359_33370 [Streptomyces morookaense]
MKHRIKARTVGKGIALASAGFAAALALSTSASAAPSLSVSPNSSLSDGQSVTVSGSGYKPGSTIVLLQCDGDKPQGTACDKQALVAAAADAKGGIKATFTVHKQFTGSNMAGGSGTSKVDCSSGHCYIGATDASHPGAQGAGVVLTFS